MGLRHGEAILLDSFDLHDRDRIVSFLAADGSKRRGVAKGARTKFSRFAGQLQPLAVASLSWFEKEGRDLVRISDVQLQQVPRRFGSSLEAILLAGYLSEHIEVFGTESEVGDALYRLLRSTVAAFESGLDPDLVARYYESWVLRLAGVFPPPIDCPLCGNALEGGRAVLPAEEEAICCRDCTPHDALGGEYVLSRETLAFLVAIDRMKLVRMGELDVPEAVLRDVEVIARRVRRLFLGKELKSYDVMKRTLAEVEA